MKLTIAKIRRQLFRRYQPSGYFIIPNSELVAASAENCGNAACGSYRVLRFGGLSYVVDCLDQGRLMYDAAAARRVQQRIIRALELSDYEKVRTLSADLQTLARKAAAALKPGSAPPAGPRRSRS